MSVFKEIRQALPSQGRKLLTAYFLKKLEDAPLNYQVDPSYKFVDALHETHDEEAGQWFNSGFIHECFEEAERQYNKLHPKKWDNNAQKAYRE